MHFKKLLARGGEKVKGFRRWRANTHKTICAPDERRPFEVNRDHRKFVDGMVLVVVVRVRIVGHPLIVLRVVHRVVKRTRATAYDQTRKNAKHTELVGAEHLAVQLVRVVRDLKGVKARG